jgi:phosphinothricin acetyltransferase
MPWQRNRTATSQVTNRRRQKISLHTVIARIAGENKVSLSLFELEDFQKIGVMKEVGRKFGKLLDVYLMQKI